MKQWAAQAAVPQLPRHCWVHHDLRHTFALRLLIFLTREGLNDAQNQGLPMSTLLDHMTGSEVRGKLRKSRQECRQLQDQVDAAATVIAALLAENAAFRDNWPSDRPSSSHSNALTPSENDLRARAG